MPTEPAGTTAVNCVADCTVNDADTPPNDTDDTESNPEPDTTTDVPPATGPDTGDNALTTGAAQYVKSFAAPATDDTQIGRAHV